MSCFWVPDKKKVDCAVKIGDRWLPIDSKFSVSALQDDKKLLKNAKERINEASGYILPESGTTNFALMFVPSEGLFLNLLEKPEFLGYAHEKRVYPVSPSTLFVFLDSVRLSAQREELAKRVDEVLSALRGWQRDLESATKNLSTATKQAQNSWKNTQEALNQLELLRNKLDQLLKAEDV